MTEHTPGPFKVINEPVGSIYFLAIGDGKQIIASLYTSVKEARANAQLFAAAPKLLAACQLAIKMIGRRDEFPSIQHWQEYEVCMTALLDAINDSNEGES